MSSDKTEHKMELLSPAGDLEKLETAFQYGADAAYMGLKNFSLRANARNFSLEDAEKIRLLKERFGTRLYCTLNIYFHNGDIDRLKESLDEIRRYPFDGFIISDIGIFDILKNAMPEREMHLSTQANCINAESARVYRSMGFDRVILGRETPISEIREIRERNPDLGIEVFVHGAMCMAYSGRCLLSAHLAGRSANRGDCAHTCRWKYNLLDTRPIGAAEDEKYYLEEETRPGMYFPLIEEETGTTILSSKDLCMIDHLRDLSEAGVDSLKIEGRMKSVYYVATATRAYRKAIDALRDPSLDAKPYRDELFNTSHREFSTGFFYSDKAVDKEGLDEVGAEDSEVVENKSKPSCSRGASDIDKSTDLSYIRDYLFLGTVKENIRDNVWSIDIKNQIRNGSRVEFIGPDVLFIPEPSIKVMDENFKILDHIDHCRNGYIETAAPIKPGYLIRAESHVLEGGKKSFNTENADGSKNEGMKSK